MTAAHASICTEACSGVPHSIDTSAQSQSARAQVVQCARVIRTRAQYTVRARVTRAQYTVRARVTHPRAAAPSAENGRDHGGAGPAHTDGRKGKIRPT
jgi:hypothetical protein